MAAAEEGENSPSGEKYAFTHRYGSALQFGAASGE